MLHLEISPIRRPKSSRRGLANEKRSLQIHSQGRIYVKNGIVAGHLQEKMILFVTYRVFTRRLGGRVSFTNVTKTAKTIVGMHPTPALFLNLGYIRLLRISVLTIKKNGEGCLLGECQRRGGGH